MLREILAGGRETTGMRVDWHARAMTIFGIALLGGCSPPEQTRLECVAGASDKLFFTMFNPFRRITPASGNIEPTDAAGVCDIMSDAAKRLNLQVERVNPTTLLISGTRRVDIVYIAKGGSLWGDGPKFKSPTVVTGLHP